MSKFSKNDKAWEKLFDKYKIVEQIEKNGYFKISATQIKEFREPRLMVKFDHTVNLPKLFSENNLAILPITRGDYLIAHFDAYHKFEEFDSKIIKCTPPDYIQSLDFGNMPSEAIALNCALASGIIADFIEDDKIIATVSGRMGSGKFDFNIQDTESKNTMRVDVNNSQIEIDGAYEGVTYLTLFEAKNDLSDDFLVRQLYYPFRVWNKRVDKPVKSVFLIYSNGIYRMYEYMFEDEYNYSSLKLIKQKNYSIEDTKITSNDIQQVLDNTKIIQEPKISFPQADKFERVINLCELLNEKELSRDEVTEEYAFDARQTNYYTDAAKYLGLLEKRRDGNVPVYKISDRGKRILKMGFKDRQLSYCREIISHKVFNEVLCLVFKNGTMPEKDTIVKIMQSSNLYNIHSEETFRRRASTISSWINWIVELINE